MQKSNNNRNWVQYAWGLTVLFSQAFYKSKTSIKQKSSF